MSTLNAFTGRLAVEHLVSEFGSFFRTGLVDPRVVWVAPSASFAAKLRHRLVDDRLGGVGRGSLCGPGVYTSQQLASRVIALAAGGEGGRQLDPTGARQLLAEVIDQRVSEGLLEQYGRLQPRGALVDLLLREIDNATARGEKPDRLLAVAGRSGDPRQREFSEVFAEWQKLKASAGVMDRFDRWRLATKLLRGGGAFGWRQAVVAPLDAVSRVEEDFLGAVLNAAERAVVAVGLAAWEDGCATPPTDLGRLGRLFDAVEFYDSDSSSCDSGVSSSEAGDSSPWEQDLAFVRGWLFRDPRDAPAPPNAESPPSAEFKGGVRVVVGGGVQQEIDWVAADVKRRLLAGLAADEVLIATPSLRLLSRRAGEAFRRVGVPIAVDAPVRIGEAPLVRALVSLLALPVDGWRHDDLLRVVTSPALRGFDRVAEGGEQGPAFSGAELAAVGFAGPRAAAELAIRRLLLPRGRDALIDQLQREVDFLARRHGGEHDPSRGDRRRLLACGAALGAAGLLAEGFDSLPRSAEPIAWFDALRGLLDRLGYSVPTGDRIGAGEFDLAALDTLEEAFASHERLNRWRGRGAGRIDLAAVAALLADWAPRVMIETGPSEEGRVRLVSIEQAVHERPRVLYAPGLAEGSLPRPLPAGDPFAESTAEARVAHARQEMQRFHQLISCASDEVVLSFPGLDDKAQPLNPSSYVAEVERLFLPRSLRVGAALDEQRPLNETTLRRGALSGLIAGRGEGLGRLTAVADADRACALLDGVAATLERSTGDTFGPMEGVLTSGAARREFAARYGPEHLWSPSQLELYAECPYKFFLRYVLGAEPLDPLAIDLDYRRRGSLLHDAMVRFHQTLPDAQGERVGDEEFLQRFELAIRTASESVAVAPHERPIARVEAMQAVAWGPRYRDQLETYNTGSGRLDEPMRPAYFEARFGPSRGGEETDATLSTDDPFRLPLEGEELLLTGRIDRIDLGVVDGRPVFNVIDYKTKKGMKAAVDDVRSGVQLQLYLYALAAERLLLSDRCAAPWRIGYWAVRDKGFLPPKENRKPLAASESIDGRLQPTDAWRSLGEEVAARLQEIVSGIRAGHFPPHYASDEAAKNCEFKGVSRSLETRAAGKLAPVFEPSSDTSRPTGNAT